MIVAAEPRADADLMDGARNLVRYAEIEAGQRVRAPGQAHGSV